MEALTRMECMKLLLTCMDLFQPQNSGYYARFSPEGQFSVNLAKGIPAGFPQDYQQMHDLSMRIYYGMLSLQLPEPFLKYPNFEEMKAQADSLPFEGCAQFLMFWCRANMRYGQDFFYKTWQEGTALRVLRRMVGQLDGYLFQQERPVARPECRRRPSGGPHPGGHGPL